MAGMHSGLCPLLCLNKSNSGHNKVNPEGDEVIQTQPERCDDQSLDLDSSDYVEKHSINQKSIAERNTNKNIGYDHNRLSTIYDEPETESYTDDDVDELGQTIKTDDQLWQEQIKQHRQIYVVKQEQLKGMQSRLMQMKAKKNQTKIEKWEPEIKQNQKEGNEKTNTYVIKVREQEDGTKNEYSEECADLNNERPKGHKAQH